MLIADMIHSCSNVHVAKAAVSCIGGGFADRVALAADRKGMEVGGFVAAAVRDFARRADGETLRALDREIAGADQPLLQALAHLLEPTLGGEKRTLPDGGAFLPPMGARHDRRYCGSVAYAH